jgi:hypothetical protein
VSSPHALKQRLELCWRGPLRPPAPVAPQHDPGLQPGPHRPEGRWPGETRPGRCLAAAFASRPSPRRRRVRSCRSSPGRRTTSDRMPPVRRRRAPRGRGERPGEHRTHEGAEHAQPRAIWLCPLPPRPLPYVSCRMSLLMSYVLLMGLKLENVSPVANIGISAWMMPAPSMHRPCANRPRLTSWRQPSPWLAAESQLRRRSRSAS